MDIVSVAIWVIVIVAVIAIALWFMRSQGVTWATIPMPIRVVIFAVIAIVCIIAIVRFAGIGRVI